ncbi:hypothetical protein [Blastopirellula marina]|uniref:Uncharacterized protein n=1 Tax=Blastopirellula marina TaxID=124 RepID=A0A2S8GEG1_9BACT|nr:hypothetical protein [Blastopirellula marina]PQO42845.1 hypothetical protein C5Y98_01450 [Blastopirellula marina]PTL46611.1 hypothetical protein C5Y97_01450 [Blastopirellula marina]
MVTMNAVVYEKNGQTYVWAFREGDEQRALEAICQSANNSELDLDWVDANIIWQRMGEAPEQIEVREMASFLSPNTRR